MFTWHYEKLRRTVRLQPSLASDYLTLGCDIYWQVTGLYSLESGKKSGVSYGGMWNNRKLTTCIVGQPEGFSTGINRKHYCLRVRKLTIQITSSLFCSQWIRGSLPFYLWCHIPYQQFLIHVSLKNIFCLVYNYIEYVTCEEKTAGNCLTFMLYRECKPKIF